MIFETAAGSIIGRDHARTGKNYQDSHALVGHGRSVIGVVCDGCGSSDHSEVGAQLGSKLVAQAVLRHYRDTPGLFDKGMKHGLERVKRTVLSQIQVLADSMGGSFTDIVDEYFLFTIMGFLIDPEKNTTVFSCGDGLYEINGAVNTINSHNNAPSYLTYSLIRSDVQDPAFNILYCAPSSETKSVLIATDGATDLAVAFNKPIPGKDEKIGSLSQFVEKDVYFKNPFAMSHRLALINRTVSKLDWDKKVSVEAYGPMRDDTTIVAARRKA